jgi:pyrimidine oxygenase
MRSSATRANQTPNWGKRDDGEIGVFLPIARNGYLKSPASPQYSPTYDLNRDVAIAAERCGFDFALAMIKLRGCGGVTRHWDECLEAFTLTAALA